MSNQKLSWRHHYLSQFYLGGFTDTGKKDGTLWATDLRNHHQWPDIPRNVGYGKHFNTLDIPGLAPDEVEKKLGEEFEGPVSNVVREIIETQKLPQGEDRVWLANLIALYGTRLPQMREHWRDFEERVRLRILKQVLASRERYEAEMQRMNQHRMEQGLDPVDVQDYEELKHVFESTEWTAKVPRELHFKREMNLLDDVVPLVLKRTWILSIAPEGSQFICSDCPVSLVWTSPIPSVSHAPGFGVPNSELTFPLSKQLALTGTFQGDEHTVEVSPARVNQINDRTVGFSERFLYSASKDFQFSDADGTMRNVQDIIECNS